MPKVDSWTKQKKKKETNRANPRWRKGKAASAHRIFVNKLVRERLQQKSENLGRSVFSYFFSQIYAIPTGHIKEQSNSSNT